MTRILHFPHLPSPPQSLSSSTSVFCRASHMVVPLRSFNHRSSGSTFNMTYLLFCFLIGKNPVELRLFFEGFFFFFGFFMCSDPTRNPVGNILFCPEKPGPLGQVRVIRLFLGVLCLKSQIPSTKSQINLKFQYSMTETLQGEILFGFSNFGHWKLFVICNLIFGISISQ